MDHGPTVEPVKSDSPSLTSGDLWSMFFRSFFIQALWNFQRMQNLGWLFGLWPALKRLHREPKDRLPLALEHMEYFNTHPYLANLILGVVAGMEEDYAAGGPVRREQILAARKSMSGPLAALGDTVFWATARPLTGVLAIAIGWIFARESGWLVPMLFLIFYNFFHVAVRGGGLAMGYHLKSQIIGFLMRLNLQQIVRGAYLLGIGLTLGALVALWAAFGRGQLLAGVFVAVALAFLRFGFSSTQVFYFMTAGSACVVFFTGTF